jgi:phytoene synthase
MAAPNTREIEEEATVTAAPALEAPPRLTAVDASAPPDSLESQATLVRRVDEDRWLASRFAPKPVRERLEAFYAFNYEIARAAEVVREPAIGDIRLTWWLDAYGAIRSGGALPAHPAVIALKEAVQAAPIPDGVIETMITARRLDFEEAPFESWAELEAYVDATAGGVLHAAIALCLGADAPRPRQQDEFVRAAGRAWGFTGLLRALPVWNARRRMFFPERLVSHVGLSREALFEGMSNHAVQSAARAVAERAMHAYVAARDLSATLPPEAFPAIGYLALEPAYRVAAVSSFHAAPPPFPLWRRQMRLLTASVFARI